MKVVTQEGYLRTSLPPGIRGYDHTITSISQIQQNGKDIVEIKFLPRANPQTLEERLALQEQQKIFALPAQVYDRHGKKLEVGNTYPIFKDSEGGFSVRV